MDEFDDGWKNLDNVCLRKVSKIHLFLLLLLYLLLLVLLLFLLFFFCFPSDVYNKRTF